MGIPDTLSVSWETCTQVKKQQLEPDMEQQTGSYWERNTSKLILSLYKFNFYAEYMMWHAGLDESQAGIKSVRRNINNFRYEDETTLMAENKEELKNLLMKVKEESEISWLKT